MMKRIFLTLVIVCAACGVSAQEKTLLNDGWVAKRAMEVLVDGNTLTSTALDRTGWMPATVPGTVLTTLINNGVFPDPEISLNNELIPDIYETGNDFYTFWFSKDFTMGRPSEGRHIWLNFRGINYKADIFLNGRRVNPSTLEGMFLRHSFDITDFLSEDGVNHLAVIVFPPTYPGKPNGGQGGDGMIARNNTMQYTPGWDWVAPVRDRNTGIWDEVSITSTGSVKLADPYVVTKVPGVRTPSAASQKDAVVKTSVEVKNVTSSQVKGTLVCETDGKKVSVELTLAPKETREVALKDIVVKNPKLWWPNGIGDQPLYDMKIYFNEVSGKESDVCALRYGIREITSGKDPDNGGRTFFVNGQKVFITGGNYINSDWLLRLSKERYLDEVRFHKDMNVRMIRVWGGALLERPDFYDACDSEGILVFQDFWGSGDCNGAWLDALKKESRERRWEYPDNHSLFLEMVEDQVKMVRNHPSLCFWCGANEWPLAKDIDEAMKTDIFPRLDPERLFASFSTDTVFTRNTMGGVGDGPYTIQEPEWFFTYHSSPFNPESGNVGTPEIETLREFMTEEELSQFPHKFSRDYHKAWSYHKDLGYRDHLERYGEVPDIETYCKHAQVVGYDQYRSFMEAWASHMWDWYTGILIWKTQNPWTGLRGQMYDWYLDVNSTLYGTAKGCEPVHPFYNIVTKQVEILNSTVEAAGPAEVKAQIFDRSGKALWTSSAKVQIAANSVMPLFEVPVPEGVSGVYFLKLALEKDGRQLTDNIYWLTTTPKDYSTLNELPKSNLKMSVNIHRAGDTVKGSVTLKNGEGISFFNRIKLFDKKTGKRILPVHYSDNYITLMPGDSRTIEFDFPAKAVEGEIEVRTDGWN